MAKIHKSLSICQSHIIASCDIQWSAEILMQISKKFEITCGYGKSRGSIEFWWNFLKLNFFAFISTLMTKLLRSFSLAAGLVFIRIFSFIFRPLNEFPVLAIAREANFFCNLFNKEIAWVLTTWRDFFHMEKRWMR